VTLHENHIEPQVKLHYQACCNRWKKSSCVNLLHGKPHLQILPCKFREHKGYAEGKIRHDFIGTVGTFTLFGDDRNERHILKFKCQQILYGEIREKVFLIDVHVLSQGVADMESPEIRKSIKSQLDARRKA